MDEERPPVTEAASATRLPPDAAAASVRSAARMYAEGQSIHSIARELSIGTARVQLLLDAAGFRDRPRSRGLADELTVSEAAELGFSEGGLRKALTRGDLIALTPENARRTTHSTLIWRTELERYRGTRRLPLLGLSKREAALRAGVCETTVVRWWHDDLFDGWLERKELRIDESSLHGFLTDRAASKDEKALAKGTRETGETARGRVAARRLRVIELLAEQKTVSEIATALETTRDIVHHDIDVMRDELVAIGLAEPKRPRNSPRRLKPVGEVLCVICGAPYTPKAHLYADGWARRCPDCVKRGDRVVAADAVLTRAEQTDLAVSVYVLGRVENLPEGRLRVSGTLDEAAERIGASRPHARRLIAAAGYPIRLAKRRPVRRKGRMVECAARRSKKSHVRNACTCKPRFIYEAKLKRSRYGEITLSRGCAQRMAIAHGLGEPIIINGKSGYVKLDAVQLRFAKDMPTNTHNAIVGRIHGRASGRNQGRQGGRTRAWTDNDAVEVRRLHDERRMSRAAITRMAGWRTSR